MPPRRRHDSLADDEPPTSAGSSSGTRKHQQKKTRFVSPAEDPANFENEIDSALEKPVSMRRKGRVKTEGYESDSSDDGEGVVPSRRPDAKKEGEDDDDDMFAMGEKEGKDDGDDEGSGKPKKEDFLRLGDIEGQEFNDASDADNGSEISDDPEDEDDAERRKKRGMGYELSSFNMREEMEEGKFSADGTFIRTYDPHAIHDRWMDGTDEREMKKARRAKRAQEKKEKERIKVEERESKGKSKEEMEIELLQYLKRGETVLEALSRLGERAKKEKEKEKKEKKTHKKDQVMDTDSASQRSTTTPSKSRVAIDHITSLASELMSLGDTEVYSKSYEHFLRSVRSVGNVEPDWVPPTTKYEYKWDVPGATTAEGGAEQTFGPFGEEELKAWYDAQYFGAAGEKVKVRVVGGEWGTWEDVVE